MGFSTSQQMQMVEAYAAGDTTTEIAAQFSTYSATVSKILRRHGVSTRRRTDPIGPDEHDQMLRLYAEGQTCASIAKKFGRSRGGVHRVVAAAGIVRSSAESKRGRFSETTRRKMADLYRDGKSLQEVAAATESTVQIVRDELNRRGIERRRVGRKTRFADEPEIVAQILKGYENGCSVPLLAEVYKCSRNAIKQVLLEADVTLRKKGPGKHVYQFTDRKGREHWMRSSWEIKTAIYLDQKGSNWDYEKETYEIGPKKRYTPDFWVYADDGSLFLVIDVKGWLYPASDDRIKLFQESHPLLPFELWGQKELTEFGILDLEIPEPPKGRKRKGLRSRISKAEITEAARLYESGMTTSQVANALNRSESAIARHLQLLGKTRNRHQTKMMMNADQETRDLAAKIYLEGNSITKTAGTLGISRDIVAREVKDRGISRSRAKAQRVRKISST